MEYNTNLIVSGYKNIQCQIKKINIDIKKIESNIKTLNNKKIKIDKTYLYNYAKVFQIQILINNLSKEILAK